MLNVLECLLKILWDGCCMHVTVMIPVYNRERFIADAIDSVIAQDYSDWDILVVDDGSADRTVDVVKSRMSDDRITLIQMKHGGIVTAVATGIEHARGPVITRLDSDDKLMPSALSTVMPSFEKNPRLGYAWTNHVNSTGEKGPCDFLPDGQRLFEAIISGWWKVTHEQFFRKEFYLRSAGLDTSIKYAEDMQIALLIGKTGCDTLHLPIITYWYRMHPDQISREDYYKMLQDASLVRRKFSNGSEALEELYLVGLEKERDRIAKEKIMRPFGSIINKALPDYTKRGKIKRKVLNLLRGSS